MSKILVTITQPLTKQTIVKMRDMRPLQIGRIVRSTVRSYIGEIVMRTASTDKFEVMSLSNLKEDVCWLGADGGDVELLDVELVVNIK